MNHELAKTLTTALVQFIDSEQPKDKMCVSSIEAEELERCFTEEKFNMVEDWYAHRMKPELTEFESRVKFVMSECSANLHDAEDIKDVKDTANELLDLAKKELARRDEVITLDKLPPYDKGFQDGKAEALKDLPRWEDIRNFAYSWTSEDKTFYDDTLGQLFHKSKRLFIGDLEKLPGFKEEE